MAAKDAVRQNGLLRQQVYARDGACTGKHTSLFFTRCCEQSTRVTRRLRSDALQITPAFGVILPTPDWRASVPHRG